MATPDPYAGVFGAAPAASPPAASPDPYAGVFNAAPATPDPYAGVFHGPYRAPGVDRQPPKGADKPPPRPNPLRPITDVADYVGVAVPEALFEDVLRGRAGYRQSLCGPQIYPRRQFVQQAMEERNLEEIRNNVP